MNKEKTIKGFWAQWRQALGFALVAMHLNRKRTALSLVGVVIGVFAVVLIMSLGNGLRQFVEAQVETFGTDLLQIEVKVPNTGNYSSQNATSRVQGVQITTLTTDDAEAISKLANIKAVYAGNIGQERARVRDTSKQILLFGTGPDVLAVDTNAKLAGGRFFTEEENASSAKVVVIGSKTKEDLFGNQSALGERIALKGEKYEVIGVLKSRGSAGFFDLDAVTYVPIKTLQKNILGVDYVQFISARMVNPVREKETMADITSLLRHRHDITDPDKDDFSVTSTEEAKQTIDSVLSAITILLLALTSISLVVGGVGIMNVMYVAVAERTKEIGLRKAVGATAEAIRYQFLAEALLVTLLGGIVGIMAGALVSIVLTYFIASLGYDFKIAFTAGSLLVGAFFAIVIGVAFGWAPAYRASELSPMEALRKE